MKGKKEIIKYLDTLIRYKEYIEQNIPAGNCDWRINQAKIEMLQWVIYGE